MYYQARICSEPSRYFSVCVWSCLYRLEHRTRMHAHICSPSLAWLKLASSPPNSQYLRQLAIVVQAIVYSLEETRLAQPHTHSPPIAVQCNSARHSIQGNRQQGLTAEAGSAIVLLLEQKGEDIPPFTSLSQLCYHSIT